MRNQAEINKKISLAMKKRVAEGTYIPPGEPFKKGYDPRRRIFQKSDRKKATKIFRANTQERWETQIIPLIEMNQIVSKRFIKKYILEKSQYTCECCGESSWLGKPIKLEVHHKDGDPKNHRLNNCEILCPNCHSFTDTYRKKKQVGMAK